MVDAQQLLLLMILEANCRQLLKSKARSLWWLVLKLRCMHHTHLPLLAIQCVLAIICVFFALLD